MYRCLSIALVSLFLLNGCATPVVSPPSQDRLTGLVEVNRLIPTSRVPQAAQSKLAVVYSVNVSQQLRANDELAGRFDSALVNFFTEAGGDATEDGRIILSSDRFMTALRAPLNRRFKEVVSANDLQSAFASGADVVAILDIRLEYKWIPTSDRMKMDHVADASVLFVTRAFEAGPDISVKAYVLQDTPASGTKANNLDFLNHVKLVRTKLLREFSGEVSKRFD